MRGLQGVKRKRILKHKNKINFFTRIICTAFVVVSGATFICSTADAKDRYTKSFVGLLVGSRRLGCNNGGQLT